MSVKADGFGHVACVQFKITILLILFVMVVLMLLPYFTLPTSFMHATDKHKWRVQGGGGGLREQDWSVLSNFNIQTFNLNFNLQMARCVSLYFVQQVNIKLSSLTGNRTWSYHPRFICESLFCRRFVINIYFFSDCDRYV